jgi:hypothetical protein
VTLFGGWKADVGFLPHKVTVFEHGERGLQLYLRWRPGREVDGEWRSGGAWKYRSLGVTFAELVAREFAKLPPSRQRKEAEAWARAKAEAQYDRNRGHTAATPRAEPALPAPPAPKLTLRAGWEKATDPDKGKYAAAGTLALAAGRPGAAGRRASTSPSTSATSPSRSRRRWRSGGRTPRGRTCARATSRSSSAGGGRPCGPRPRRRPPRRRPTPTSPGHGFASGVATVARVLAVADWLRDEGHIPPGAALPSRTWKKKAAEDFARLYTKGVAIAVAKPRYTIDEIRRLFAAARTGEPRVALLLALGAELRPGQVLRSRRRDLTLPAVDWTAPVADPDDTDYGACVVHGAGAKGGETVFLTRGQRLEVDRALGRAGSGGYLRVLEAAHQAGRLADYPLFPGEKLPGQKAGDPVASVARHGAAAPLDEDNARKHFRAIERAAGITPVPGRVFYGIRRGNVDEAIDIALPANVLKHLGGWASEATPRDIYAERESARDRRKARTARSKIRGEAHPEASGPGEGTPAPVNSPSTGVPTPHHPPSEGLAK